MRVAVHPRLQRGRRTRRGRASRPGMTFLEVVMATAVLAIIAASLLSAFSFVISTQSRERQRLMAMEVANRLVIAYLDDPTKMPDPNKLLEYGPPEAPLKFRWQYREEPVTVHEANPASPGASTRERGVSGNTFRRVVVRVWLSEQSGGGERPDGSIPTAELSRMLDPLALRNPDAINRLMQDSDVMRNFLNNLVGAQQAANEGGASRRGGGARDGRRERAPGVLAPQPFGYRQQGNRWPSWLGPAPAGGERAGPRGGGRNGGAGGGGGGGMGGGGGTGGGGQRGGGR